MLASAILLVGLAVSLVTAIAWRSSVHRHDMQAFQTNSTDVSETLETLLSRDTNFVACLRAVLTMQPHLDATQFDQWFARVSDVHTATLLNSNHTGRPPRPSYTHRDISRTNA
jgi:hypothetical protein